MVTTVVIVSFILVMLGMIALRSYRHKRQPAAEHLINSSALVEHSLTPDGSVLVHGELWLARSVDGSHKPAQTRVIIVGTQDHLLLVA